jgi:hypothetical protein
MFNGKYGGSMGNAVAQEGIWWLNWVGDVQWEIWWLNGECGGSGGNMVAQWGM